MDLKLVYWLVCDGASSNVSAINASHDFQGAYSLNEKLEDKYLIELWMINPTYSIIDLYKRDIARVDQGCTRMVP